MELEDSQSSIVSNVLLHHLHDYDEYMKRSATALTLCCTVACSAPPGESEENDTINPAAQVISHCAEAMGGSDLVENLRTFRTTVSWDGGDPVVTEVQRPNLFKTLGRATLVFDGERAAKLANPEERGPEAAAEILDAGVWKDFEIDLAFNFPAFFDYPAQYLGLDSLDGVAVHELIVTLPLGTIVTYLLDADSYLPLVARTQVTIDGTEYTPERVYHEFTEVEGILFPSRFTQGWTPETAQPGVLESAELNVEFSEHNFQIPAQLTVGG